MPSEADLVNAFKTFDVNGDGHITPQEMISILTRPTASGHALSYADAQSLVAEFDVSGDGRLNMQEFFNLMGSNKALPMPGQSAMRVGTAFDFLNPANDWQPITDKSVIDALGRLCSAIEVQQVEYSIGSNSYTARQGRDGTISQMNVATRAIRPVRLVPFFFEYEEGPRDWRPVTQPEALTALTAVLASSKPKTYKAKNIQFNDFQPYEATLLNSQGLIQQRNTNSGKLRRVRATPVGIDGANYFEFRDGAVGSDKWSLVAPSCVKQLAAVAVGRGDAYYTITYPHATFQYHARLENDGHIIQMNLSTRAERPIRPAPWHGHGKEVALESRADATEGYVPGMQAAEEVRRAPEEWAGMGRRAAAEFHVPEQVEMGLPEAPVQLVEAEIPMAQPVGPVVYYYQPPIPMAMPMDPSLPMATFC